MARSFLVSFGSRRVSYSCTSCAQGRNLSWRLLFTNMRLSFSSPECLVPHRRRYFFCYFGCSLFSSFVGFSFRFVFFLFLLVFPDMSFRDEWFPGFLSTRWCGGHAFGEVVSAELWFASGFVLAYLVCASSQSFLAFVGHRHDGYFQFASTPCSSPRRRRFFLY